MPVDPRLCYRVSSLYQSRGRGCAGNVIGVDGTLNWRSSARMCRSLRLEGRTIIDIGCGNGRFMAMALVNRAYRVLGCEFPENHAQQLIYFAVLEEIVLDLDGFGLPNGLNTEYYPCDIEKVQPRALHTYNDFSHSIHNPWSAIWAVVCHARISGNPSRLRLHVLGGHATRNPACHSEALCPLRKCRHAGCFPMR
jgi:SAM-dependent methyltransferase